MGPLGKDGLGQAVKIVLDARVLADGSPRIR